ncbi:MAG: DUF2934 domain-containing protein [Methylococcaceae bacterium]
MAASAKEVENEVILESTEPCNVIHLPDMEAKIAELAYYKAEKRGFLPGYELCDWLEAERELGL